MTDVVTGLGPRWEASVATALERVRGVTIARRCADVAELLSVTEAGVGQAAVVSADLRGLDLDVVARLRAAGVRVVGLHPADDEAAQRLLRQLGVAVLLPVDATPDAFLAALEPIDVAAQDGGRDGDPLQTDLDELAGLTDLRNLDGPGVGQDPHGRRRAPQGSEAGDPSDPIDPSDPSDPDDLDHSSSSGWSGGLGWRPRGTSPGNPRHPASDADADDAAQPGRRDGRRRGRGSVAATVHPPPERARIVAVWGPTGAPGRTLLATTLAAEVASRGTEVLLVDADTYGGSVAQTLGLLDEAPGIAAACRAAEQGTLDVPVLAGLAPEAMPGLRVLTGLPKAERWTEIRSAALERVLELSRSLVTLVVIDCGFCLEDDELLSYDTAAPRRNEATLTSLAAADTVLAVGGADPVALQRFVRGLQELGTVPSPPPVPVVNRVRSAAVGSRPEARIAASLQRFAGLDAVRFVPDDTATVDAALLAGRSVVEHAPESPVRHAIADLATTVAPWTVAGPRRSRNPRRPRLARVRA
ncbi:MAG: hypothetical protein JWP82_1096 [Humibacillus sp.]|nr:hypothetical protein [Humibacillus sp.]